MPKCPQCQGNTRSEPGEICCHCKRNNFLMEKYGNLGPRKKNRDKGKVWQGLTENTEPSIEQKIENIEKPIVQKQVKKVEYDLSKIRVVKSDSNSQTKSVAPLANLPDEQKESDEFKTIKKKRKKYTLEKDKLFEKSEWKLEETETDYFLIRKYFKGPNFQEKIRLTKKSFIVKDNGTDNYDIEVLKREIIK